jgi:hypothetical protein
VRPRLGPPSKVAVLGFSVTDVIFNYAHAGTCGHDRQTAATRCAEVRSPLMIGRATRSGWLDNESADVERARPRYAARKLDSNVKVSETS